MINDPKLAQLTNLMSQIIALQAMCKAVKRAGLEFPELDDYLIRMNEVSHIVVRALNERLVELENE